MSEDGTNHEEVLRRAAENTELSLALRRACQAAVMSHPKTSRLGDWLALDARVSALRQALDEANSKLQAALDDRAHLVRRNQLLLRVRNEINWRIESGLTSNGNLEAIKKFIDANIEFQGVKP
jgi:hypothetical protein